MFRNINISKLHDDRHTWYVRLIGEVDVDVVSSYYSIFYMKFIAYYYSVDVDVVWYSLYITIFSREVYSKTVERSETGWVRSRYVDIYFIGTQAKHRYISIRKQRMVLIL